MPDLLTILGDKALDVDPDLRFMALEDLRKYLNDPKGDIRPRQIEKFIPILFRLLKDTNPNVQSQAVKTFAPVIGYVDDNAVLNVLTKLYEEVEKENTDGRITTSIPSMALHNILSADHRWDAQLARRIVASLIPAVFANKTTIDSMELLIDVVGATGFVLDDAEILDLLVSVVDVVFQYNGMLGTRAAVALQELLSHFSGGTSSQILHQLTELVSGHHGDIHKKLALFSTLLKHSPPQSTIRIVQTTINDCLSLPETHDLENIDLDVVARDNSIRAAALSTLAEMVTHIRPELVPVEQCVDAVVRYAIYDPLSLADSDDEEDALSDMSDLEFEDDGDEDVQLDDGSWRVCFRACSLCKSLVGNVPEAVSVTLETCLDAMIAAMTGSSDAVAEEAILAVSGALSAVGNDTVLRDSLAKIELASLKLLQKPALAQNVLELVVGLAPKNVAVDFWDQLFSQLDKQNNTEHWRIYRAVLTETASDRLSTRVVELIASDVAHTLQTSSMHYFVSENLAVASLLLQRNETSQKFQETLLSILDTIIAKCGDRQYSSELRQELISTLCEYMAVLNISPSQQEQCSTVLLSALGYETTMRTVLTSSAPIFSNQQLAQTAEMRLFASSLAQRLLAVLTSPDETYHALSLHLLTSIAGLLDKETTQNTMQVVVNFGLNAVDSQVVAGCFAILAKTNIHLGPEEVDVIARLAIKIDDEHSVGYFRDLATNYSGDLFETVKGTLAERPRILAAIAVAQQSSAIGNIVGSATSVEQLTFLGWAAYYGANIAPGVFFERLEDPTSAVKTAAASSVGLVIAKELRLQQDATLEQLLRIYSENPHLRAHLLLGFRHVPATKDEHSASVWNRVWQTVWLGVADTDLEHQLGELRQAGDVLAMACTANPALLEQQSHTTSDAEVYVHIAVLKQLLTKPHPAELLRQRLLQILPAIDRMNIEIKQAMIGTYLTAIHRRSDVAEAVMDTILAAVYGQLEARDEFKKTIPMGPYKYVIDEGLEIRKLCYELLYTVAGNSTISSSIAEKAIQFGVADSQPEVVIVACGVVRRCVAACGDAAGKTADAGTTGGYSASNFIGSQPVMTQLIENVRTVFAKKPRAKASTQETEMFETMIRTVVQMANDVNTCISHMATPEIQHEWSRFFHEVETRM